MQVFLLKSVICLYIIFFFSSLVVFAQKELGKEVSIQSPNASSLGKFGDIPVSLFSGAADISIPITTINNGSISVPISLNYDASGCRPDEHPSLVGLNWNIFTGGIIKRQTNGDFDDQRRRLDVVGDHMGYYDKYPLLAPTNWYSSEYMPSQGKWYDLFPDEFTFNFNGISGAFLLNHEKKWIVRSKENLNLKVSHEIQEDVPGVLSSLPVPRIISKFILTTDDGTQYIFGGDINAIEFSHSALATLIDGWNYHGGNPNVNNAFWQEYVQASAWNLTEIISPDGNRIKFYYSRFKNVKQAHYSEVSKTTVDGPIENSPYYIYDINQTNKFMVYGCNIDSIRANHYSCRFVRSVSNELAALYKVKPSSLDWCPSDFANQPYYKLDSLIINVNNLPIAKHAFNYIEKPTERLKLKEVKKLSSTNNVEYSYKLEYSKKLLPDYYSGFLDHWGYYNGKNYWGTSSYQSSAQAQVPDLTAYFQSREPDSNLMDAEILKKIIYPTGGYSEFFFEPHTYSAVVKQSPSISIEALSSNKMAGGLRIKMIKSHDAVSASNQTRQFFYSKDFINGGTLSSGVLAGDPVYYEIAPSNERYKFSSLPLNYLNTTNGSHITYTNVVETDGNGYTIYTYTNHDNGYLDKAPINQVSVDVESTKFLKKLYGRLDLERGLLLSTKSYTTGWILQREVINTYNQDPNRYNKFVRAISQVVNSALYATWVAFPLYTFYPYLEKQTTIDYTSDGNTLKNEKIYSYDNSTSQLRRISSVDAKGIQKYIYFKYPTDYTYTSNASSINEIYDIKALVDQNILKFPIETTSSIIKSGNEYVIRSTMLHFENFKPERSYELETNVPIPVSEFAGTYSATSGFQYDSRYKEKLSYTKYDDRGNLLEIIPKDNIPISYIWAYNKTYPIAKVLNASNNDVNTVLGVSRIAQLAMSYDDTDVRNAMQQLRVGLPASEVYSYTYSPLIGMTSETAPNNVTTYYEYDQFGRLTTTRDDKQKILKKIAYGYMEIKRISLSDETIDFGQVPVGHIATRNVLVTNTGTVTLTISNIILPVGYTISNAQPISLVPGESIRLDLTYSASTKGTYANTIQFVTDAVGNKNINTQVTVVGTKIINVTGNLSFGTITGGPMYGCLYSTMTISNTGTEPLTVTNVSTTAPFSANWTSGIIPPGQNRAVTISFCPPVPGSFSFPIVVTSDKTSGTDTIIASGNAN